MVKDVLLSLWFFLPAGAANMAPVFANKIPFIRSWDAPIDGGALFRGRQLLGPHKTWRGITSGILVGVLCLWLQQLASVHTHVIHDFVKGIAYSTLPTILMGTLFAIGALGGDAAKSFFKRQHGTPSGETWFPFDQTDYIIGSILTSLLLVRLHIVVYVWALVLWPLLHLVAAYLGFLLGLKNKPL